MAYYQATGAVLSVGIFAGLSLVETAYLSATHGFVSPTDVIGVNMIVALTAGSLVAVNRVLMTPDQDAEVDPALRLSKREREVLALVAEGYSNPMIAPICISATTRSRGIWRTSSPASTPATVPKPWPQPPV